MSIYLDTILALERQTDRQTDRRTDGFAKTISHSAWTHDKSCVVHTTWTQWSVSTLTKSFTSRCRFIQQDCLSISNQQLTVLCVVEVTVVCLTLFRFAMIISRNPNLQELWDVKTHSNVTLMRGSVQLLENAKLCVNLINEFMTHVRVARGNKPVISQTTNGYSTLCTLASFVHSSF